MRSKALLIVLTVLGVAALGSAQSNVSVLFPDAGDREVWIASGLPSVAPTDSLRTKASSVDVPAAGKKPTDTLFVWDKGTGNLATHSLKDALAEGSWTVPSSAFKDIAQVKIHVEHAGSPLNAADVTLDDGRRAQNLLMDAASNGDVVFFDVKPGQLKVTAKYKAKTGETKSIVQLVDSPFGRSDLIPSATISVAEDVETAGGGPARTGAGGVGGAGASTAAMAPKNSPKLEDQGGNTIGSVVIYLVGLVFAIGVGFLLFRYGKQNQSLVESKLKQLGVDIPQPGDDMGGPVQPLAPMAPAKPEPPQKIILDDAAPTPIAVAAPVISVATGEPKLVSDSGDAMLLPEGETLVGREAGLGLSLVGETTVSRQHAKLVKMGTDVTLTDLGSTNGTYVNGVQLSGSTALRSGDAVQFGAIRFRYEG